MITNEQIATLKNLTICGLWPDQIVALRAAISTLERLPVTRDGVRVVPMVDKPWVVQPSGHVSRGHRWDNAEQLFAGYQYDQHYRAFGQHVPWFVNVSDCYSTQAAALAGKEGNK